MVTRLLVSLAATLLLVAAARRIRSTTALAGRFSGVDDWPGLGVDRGEAPAGVDSGQCQKPPAN